MRCKPLLRLYFRLKTWWPVWYYALNSRARKKLHADPPVLDNLQRRIVRELRKSGIATTTLEELFPGEHWLERLTAYVDQHRHEVVAQTKKPYLKNFWEVHPPLDFDNPYLQLSVNQCILDIVNSYMQMYTKLNYYFLAQTIPVGNARETKSQRWHRDPEEPRMCKMFIYLSDVDETAGPFIYIPYTVRGQKWSHLFPQKSPSGNYPPEESVNKIPQHETRLTITGAAGTVIFCDTTGLHRGGYATVKERVMFTAFYTSPCWSEPPRYKRSDTSRRYLNDLSPQARYALEH